MKTLGKKLFISNIVLLIIGYTYGLYLLLFDGRGHPLLVSFLREFALLLGIIDFVQKQKLLGVLMIILVVFFSFFGFFCFFNSGHSSC